jgi:hypothetical protein
MGGGVMSTRAEQETTVTASKTDAVVYVWTSDPVHLRRLRKDARATELAGDDEWGRFTIPADQFDPLKGFRRQGRVLTEQERAVATERLAAARASRIGATS